MILKIFRNKTKVLFLHIPKTGGTAVKKALKKKFKPKELQLIYGFENFKMGVRDFATNKKSLGIGHFGWEPEMENMFKDAFKITFLRHPVARVISHYWHFQRSTLEGDQYVKEMSFEDFLETPFAQDWQTRRLGGGLYDASLTGEACFEEALKNVESRFEFVGITEEMDKSAAILSKRLSIDIGDVKRKNVNPEKAKEHEMALKYEAVILAKNQYDLQLYEAGFTRLNLY
ncbi:sulfotransferase family 2 domain-containing protein [Owenweeksia hongkongensis]|uniref:sulfotransferase family 2 domain-containing protein n=1 Tax=Owenweeksia hongkongensis TaxID=253245 RepID=UPI003A95124A